MLGKEVLGHDDAEHRVTQELQALVCRQPAGLVREGPVGQCEHEELGVNLCPQRFDQRLKADLRR